MTGAIACGQYSVAPPGTVQLHDQSISVAVSATATALYTINANGNVTSIATLEAWLISGTAANYEVMVTLTAGNALTGTSAAQGSWLNCGSTRSWALRNSARDNSVLTSALAVQLRDVATHTVQASASITLSAESDA